MEKTVRVYSENDIFLGLGKVFVDGERKKMKVEKLFVSNDFIIH